MITLEKRLTKTKVIHRDLALDICDKYVGTKNSKPFGVFPIGTLVIWSMDCNPNVNYPDSKYWDCTFVFQYDPEGWNIISGGESDFNELFELVLAEDNG